MEINADLLFALTVYSVIAALWVLMECLIGGFVRADLRFRNVFVSGLTWPLELSYIVGYALRFVLDFLRKKNDSTSK